MQKKWIGACLVAALCTTGLAAAAAAQETSGAPSSQSQEESIADAARKARELKKTEAPAKQVWTNENIPRVPTEEPAAAKAGEEGAGEEGAKAPGEEAKGAKPSDDAKKSAEQEALWRQKFADAHKKLEEDQKELEVMERELGLKRQQYFSDPNTALRDQYQRDSGTGGEVNTLVQKIDEQKKKIEDDKQAIDDLEEQLRKAGLPAGWSRP